MQVYLLLRCSFQLPRAGSPSNWPVVFLTRGTKLVLNLSVPDRREDTGINEPESIPLRRSLGLEVPPDPTLGCGLVGADLSLNIAPGIVLERRGPLRNVVSPAALAKLGVVQIGAVEACATSVAIQVLCTVPSEKSANLPTMIRKMGILTSWRPSTLQLNTWKSVNAAKCTKFPFTYQKSTYLHR